MTNATSSSLLGLTVLEDTFMTVVVESLAAGRQAGTALEQQLRDYTLIPTQEQREF